MESRPDDSRRRFMKGALWVISASSLGTGVMLSPTASAAPSLTEYKPVFLPLMNGRLCLLHANV